LTNGLIYFSQQIFKFTHTSKKKKQKPLLKLFKNNLKNNNGKTCIVKEKLE